MRLRYGRAAVAAVMVVATQVVGCAGEPWPPPFLAVPPVVVPPAVALPAPPAGAPAPSLAGEPSPAPGPTPPQASVALAAVEPAAATTGPPAPLPPAPPSSSPAAERFRFGVQVALLTPFAGDLPYTTGFPLSGSIGVHADWRLAPRHLIRPRIDAAFFWSGRESGSTATVSQIFSTQVSSLSLGADYLFRLGGEEGRFSVGAHLAAIRWAVRSTNTITIASGDSASVSGTSSWWRPGLGLVAEYRIWRQLSAEGRLVFSQYGQENVQATTASLGLLWAF